jgi:hypothetical protein
MDRRCQRIHLIVVRRDALFATRFSVASLIELKRTNMVREIGEEVLPRLSSCLSPASSCVDIHTALYQIL